VKTGKIKTSFLSSDTEILASRNWVIFGVVALALLIRLFYLLVASGISTPPQFDGIGYDMIARNLLAGNGFVLDGRPTAFRPPGYPAFLALIYALGGDWAVLRVIQAFLGAATVWVTYKLAMLAFSQHRLALLAALFVALHPVLLYLTGLIYPESLAILLITLAIWLLMVLTRERFPNIGGLVLFGVLLSAIVLLRPGMLVFAVLGIGWFWMAHRERKGSFAKAILILLVLILCILPWTLRNYLVFGEFIPLATEGGVTFWGGNHPLGHGGHVEPSPATWLGPNPPPQSLYGWPDLTEKGSENRFYQAAFNWIFQEPDEFLSLLPQKLVRSWTLTFGNEARPVSLPGWISLAYLLYPLSVLMGLVLSLRHWKRLLPIYCLLIAQTLTTLAFYGSTRQSALVVPAVLTLSAFAIDRVADVVIVAVKSSLGSTAKQISS
jgi:4-amino-4-deoxy-L-arabinose transferase-like glycosyltransferase